jgi:lysophospholipase L1-like esterase
MDKLICFGASSAQGVGDSEGGFFKRLERKLAGAGRAFECINCGLAGDTTSDMLARLERVKRHLPARSIIFLGSNDLPRDRDSEPHRRTGLAEYKENVEEIVKVLGGSGSLFVTPFAVCPIRTGVQPAVFSAYLKAASKIAASYQMTIWDFYTESLDFGDRYLAEDGMHYHDAGHEVIAEGLLKRV